jgi:hypothetical protein
MTAIISERVINGHIVHVDEDKKVSLLDESVSWDDDEFGHEDMVADVDLFLFTTWLHETEKWRECVGRRVKVTYRIELLP